MLMDAPVSFPAGAGQPPYAPQNYDRKFEGPITLRRALEQSRNVPAVRLMEQLGPQQVIAYAQRLRLRSRRCRRICRSRSAPPKRRCSK